MLRVESKTMEIGIMRMVGMRKISFSFMVIIQGFIFTLPAILAGFILSPLVLGIVYYIL